MVHSNDDYENKSGFKFTKTNPVRTAMQEPLPAGRPLRTETKSRPGDLDLRPAQKDSAQGPPAQQHDMHAGAPLEQDASLSGYPRQGTSAGGYSPPQRTTGLPHSDRTPTALESPHYTAGFLEGFIGSRMRVEFQIGTSGTLTDRTGRLAQVGANYIVLEPELTDDLLYADLYSIQFITIYR